MTLLQPIFSYFIFADLPQLLPRATIALGRKTFEGPHKLLPSLVGYMTLLQLMFSYFIFADLPQLLPRATIALGKKTFEGSHKLLPSLVGYMTLLQLMFSYFIFAYSHPHNCGLDICYIKRQIYIIITSSKKVIACFYIIFTFALMLVCNGIQIGSFVLR